MFIPFTVFLSFLDTVMLGVPVTILFCFFKKIILLDHSSSISILTHWILGEKKSKRKTMDTSAKPLARWKN